MAFSPFPLTVPLMESEQESTETALYQATFGDGYEQRAEIGLNAQRRTGSWAFIDARATIASAEGFLESDGASGFTFQPPGAAAARTYKCTRWKRTWFNGDADKLVCQFEQIFDVEV